MQKYFNVHITDKNNIVNNLNIFIQIIEKSFSKLKQIIIR